MNLHGGKLGAGGLFSLELRIFSGPLGVADRVFRVLLELLARLLQLISCIMHRLLSSESAHENNEEKQKNVRISSSTKLFLDAK